MPQRSRGYTLVEVVISMLLVALMVGGLMSVVLTSKSGVKVSDTRAAAALAGGRLLDRLKLYVTADPFASPGPAPGTTPNGWGLPGDGCSCYALAVGSHTLDPAVWLPELAAQGGRIGYDVALRTTPQGARPTVTLRIDWDERLDPNAQRRSR